MKKLIYNIKNCLVTTRFIALLSPFSHKNTYLRDTHNRENIFNEYTYKDDVVDVGRGISCLCNRASSAPATTSFYNKH